MTLLKSAIVFCCYAPTTNNKRIYTKFWREDDSEGASKRFQILGTNHPSRVFLVLESKCFPFFSEVTVTVVKVLGLPSIRVSISSALKVMIWIQKIFAS